MAEWWTSEKISFPDGIVGELGLPANVATDAMRRYATNVKRRVRNFQGLPGFAGHMEPWTTFMARLFVTLRREFPRSETKDGILRGAGVGTSWTSLLTMPLNPQFGGSPPLRRDALRRLLLKDGSPRWMLDYAETGRLPSMYVDMYATALRALRNRAPTYSFAIKPDAFEGAPGAGRDAVTKGHQLRELLRHDSVVVKAAITAAKTGNFSDAAAAGFVYHHLDGNRVQNDKLVPVADAVKVLGDKYAHDDLNRSIDWVSKPRPVLRMTQKFVRQDKRVPGVILEANPAAIQVLDTNLGPGERQTFWCKRSRTMTPASFASQLPLAPVAASGFEALRARFPGPLQAYLPADLRRQLYPQSATREGSARRRLTVVDFDNFDQNVPPEFVDAYLRRIATLYGDVIAGLLARSYRASYLLLSDKLQEQASAAFGFAAAKGVLTDPGRPSGIRETSVETYVTSLATHAIAWYLLIERDTAPGRFLRRYDPPGFGPNESGFSEAFVDWLYGAPASIGTRRGQCPVRFVVAGDNVVWTEPVEMPPAWPLLADMIPFMPMSMGTTILGMEPYMPDNAQPWAVPSFIRSADTLVAGWAATDKGVNHPSRQYWTYGFVDAYPLLYADHPSASDIWWFVNKVSKATLGASVDEMVAAYHRPVEKAFRQDYFTARLLVDPDRMAWDPDATKADPALVASLIIPVTEADGARLLSNFGGL